MRRVVWLMMGVLGLLYLALWRGAGVAERSAWGRYMAAGTRLEGQGHTLEAGRWYQAAIRRAERFGPADPRLAASLSRYAALLRATGQAAAAAPLEARARVIRKRNGEAAAAAVKEAPVPPPEQAPSPYPHPRPARPPLPAASGAA